MFKRWQFRAHCCFRCSKGGVSEFLNDLYVLLTRRLAQNGRFYFFGSFGLSENFLCFRQMLCFIYFRDQWPPAGFEATLRHAQFLDDLYTFLRWTISHDGCFYSERSCGLLKPACTPLQMLYFVYFWDQWPPMQSIVSRDQRSRERHSVCPDIQMGIQSLPGRFGPSPNSALSSIWALCGKKAPFFTFF